jgi:hypothetical protein
MPVQSDRHGTRRIAFPGATPAALSGVAPANCSVPMPILSTVAAFAPTAAATFASALTFAGAFVTAARMAFVGVDGAVVTHDVDVADVVQALGELEGSAVAISRRHVDLGFQHAVVVAGPVVAGDADDFAAFVVVMVVMTLVVMTLVFDGRGRPSYVMTMSVLRMLPLPVAMR